MYLIVLIIKETKDHNTNTICLYIELKQTRQKSIQETEMNNPAENNCPSEQNINISFTCIYSFNVADKYLSFYPGARRHLHACMMHHRSTTMKQNLPPYNK